MSEQEYHEDHIEDEDGQIALMHQLENFDEHRHEMEWQDAAGLT